MAKTVSWREKQRSAGVASPLSSIDLALSSMKLSRPENETSMPFTTYGSGTYLRVRAVGRHPRVGRGCRAEAAAPRLCRVELG